MLSFLKLKYGHLCWSHADAARKNRTFLMTYTAVVSLLQTGVIAL